MKYPHWPSPWLILAAAAVLGIGSALALSTAQAQAAAPAPPPPPAHADNPDLEAQLEAARRRLEEAAHQVAELSAQMSGPLFEKFAAFDGFGVESGRAMLGVQLEGAAEAGGARVREVSPGGPAEDAGIRAGDVIVQVNGTAIGGEQPARQVLQIMREVKPDTKVSVRARRAGKTRDFTVTARSGPVFLARAHGMPDFEFGPPGPLPPPGIMGRGPLMDMELVTLTPQLGRYFGAEQGVLVVRAARDGALKLEDGDVIVSIDGRQPASGSHATRILSSYQPGEKLSLHVIRDHKTLDLQVTMPERGALHDGARPEGALRGAALLPEGRAARAHRVLIRVAPAEQI